MRLPIVCPTHAWAIRPRPLTISNSDRRLREDVDLLLQRLGTRRHDKPLEVPFAVGNGPQYDDARLLRGRARTAVPAVDESHEPSALRVHLPDSDAARLEASRHEDEGILAPRREDAAVRDPGRATRNLRDAFVGPTALRGFLCSYPGG